jgi:hypothetical protein|tara:strand:+ start:561 stop:1184 length:624 start_codon:yes stop_codon:yes gene_type:complete
MQLAKGQARAMTQRPRQQYAESAKYIQNTLTEIYDYAIDRYRRVGETLLYVKEDMDDLPSFHAWVAENITNPSDGRPLSIPSADQYMLVARRTSKRLGKKHGDIYIKPTATTTMTQVLTATRSPRERPRTRRAVPEWEPVVREELASPFKARRTDARQINDLARRIITLGYKALAIQLHPDKPDGDAYLFTLLGKAKRELMKTRPTR